MRVTPFTIAEAVRSVTAAVLAPARVPYILVPVRVAPFTIPEAVRSVTAAVLAPVMVPYILVPERVAPFTISSNVAATPNKAPEMPTPPPMVTVPVVLEEDVVEPVTPRVPFIFTAIVFDVFMSITESVAPFRV